MSSVGIVDIPFMPRDISLRSRRKLQHVAINNPEFDRPNLGHRLLGAGKKFLRNLGESLLGLGNFLLSALLLGPLIGFFTLGLVVSFPAKVFHQPLMRAFCFILRRLNKQWLKIESGKLYSNSKLFGHLVYFTLVCSGEATALALVLRTSISDSAILAFLPALLALQLCYSYFCSGLEDLTYRYFIQRSFSRLRLLPSDLEGFLNWCSDPQQSWLRRYLDYRTEYRNYYSYEFRHRDLLEYLAYEYEHELRSSTPSGR
jgi:hypothetical protein